MSLLYIGTYTRANSKGIYCCRFSPAAGELTGLRLAAPMTNPSFLAVHPGGQFLYAVSEVSLHRGGNSGAVSAFRVNSETGDLALLGDRSSSGRGPCRLAVDLSGRNVLVANYGAGNVAVLPVEKDGTLGNASAVLQHMGAGTHPVRQAAPHVHSVQFSADNRLAFIADLGLDKVFLYRFDAAEGSLVSCSQPFVQVAAGAGPRHLVLHPRGLYAYLINELASTVNVFSWNPSAGTLREVQTLSTLPEDFHGDNGASEILAHPEGKVLYCGNRGHDSIAVLAVDPRQGTLVPLQFVNSGGKTPRHFVIDPTGSWLLVGNQDSNNLAVFRIHPATGALTRDRNTIEVDSPACLSFLATVK